ncbi:hypothetical protein MLD38_012552 [Melastoma candidum]|uniref:Uncharacterized protein n=1 Tax=Melastoma candidum TaxID=119954 RepID=A0ACB9RF42_9MYRT|nr:hypothetical protein MLD38_012552 [Melastoma candidum]
MFLSWRPMVSNPYLKTAETHRETYTEKLSASMLYYRADSEEEILTGSNLQKKASWENRRHGDMKDHRTVDSRGSSTGDEVREAEQEGPNNNEATHPNLHEPIGVELG